MADTRYLEPTTLAEVFDALEQYGDDARLLSGGTGLVNLMKQRLVLPECLIGLRRVPGLNLIQRENGALRCGRAGYPTGGRALPGVAGERIPADGDLQPRSNGAYPQCGHSGRRPGPRRPQPRPAGQPGGAGRVRSGGVARRHAGRAGPGVLSRLL